MKHLLCTTAIVLSAGAVSAQETGIVVGGFYAGGGGAFEGSFGSEGGLKVVGTNDAIQSGGVYVQNSDLDMSVSSDTWGRAEPGCLFSLECEVQMSTEADLDLDYDRSLSVSAGIIGTGNIAGYVASSGDSAGAAESRGGYSNTAVGDSGTGIGDGIITLRADRIASVAGALGGETSIEMAIVGQSDDFKTSFATGIDVDTEVDAEADSGGADFFDVDFDDDENFAEFEYGGDDNGESGIAIVGSTLGKGTIVSTVKNNIEAAGAFDIDSVVELEGLFDFDEPAVPTSLPPPPTTLPI